jgi:arylsulfatase A-like enzyme
MAGLEAQSAPMRQRYIEAYTAEVEYADRWLAGVVEKLKRTGLWDSSIVVFWSDHGEEFWEHGGWEHGHTLYNELLHVPLLIHLPGQSESHHVQQPVTLLDVMPTLLEY